MSGSLHVSHRAELHAGLHALSQPLTVLGLALTLAQTSTSEAERAFAMDAALTECQRAMESMRHLRQLVDSGLGLPPSATGAAHPLTNAWSSGGAA